MRVLIWIKKKKLLLAFYCVFVGFLLCAAQQNGDAYKKKGGGTPQKRVAAVAVRWKGQKKNRHLSTYALYHDGSVGARELHQAHHVAGRRVGQYNLGQTQAGLPDNPPTPLQQQL